MFEGPATSRAPGAASFRQTQSQLGPDAVRHTSNTVRPQQILLGKPAKVRAGHFRKAALIERRPAAITGSTGLRRLEATTPTPHATVDAVASRRLALPHLERRDGISRCFDEPSLF